jgi:hypothetical protein
LTGICVDCKNNGLIHNHHVVPRALGGTYTVPLCEYCHTKVHDKNMTTSALTKAALAASKAKGTKLGTHGKVLAVEQKKKADQYALSMSILISEVQQDGHKTLRAISDELNRRGIPSARGGKWSYTTVHRVQKRLRKVNNI